MLDIKLIRSDPKFVQSRLAARLADPALIDHLLELDQGWREETSRLEEMQSRLNRDSKLIGQLMRSGSKTEAQALQEANRTLGDEIAAKREQVREWEAKRDELLLNIPNLPGESIPSGGEENFQIVRTVGETPHFSYPPKPHWEIAQNLNLIDFARGAKMTGSGFALYRGHGALLERALIAFLIDFHIDRHGYTEWSPPYFLNAESVLASAHLPKFRPEMYYDAEADLYALPTAEPALINIHRDEMLDGRDFPLNYVAYSPCWRREAGAAGKDTRGLLRVHQFDKVEMVRFVLPEKSDEALEEIVSHATDILDALGLSYRVKLLAAGDISFAAQKCFDIEVYAPGVDAWLEVSSCSNCGDFQSRRGNIRLRREPGAKPEHPHLLNASGTALPRLVAALLETHQKPDGSVAIPAPLAPYMRGMTQLSPVGKDGFASF